VHVQVLEALHEHGFTVIGPDHLQDDPDDTRSRRVYMTARGVSTIGVIRGAVTRLERDWEAQLGPARWRQLEDLLLELDNASTDAPGP
jgi:hypothetical protein